jgi:hypothetical protein
MPRFPASIWRTVVVIMVVPPGAALCGAGR